MEHIFCTDTTEVLHCAMHNQAVHEACIVGHSGHSTVLHLEKLNGTNTAVAGLALTTNDPDLFDQKTDTQIVLNKKLVNTDVVLKE